MAERTTESLLSVVVQGDRRKSLEALRDRLAEQIDVAEPRETASLAKQLAEVLEGLAPEEKSDLDDLASRRAARRSSVSKRAAGKRVGGTGSS